MTAADDSSGEKYGLEFIDMFNSMMKTCERMKATIKRIQSSSNADVKNRVKHKKQEAPSTSTHLLN